MGNLITDLIEIWFQWEYIFTGVLKMIMNDALRSKYLATKCFFLGKDHEGGQLMDMPSHPELIEFLHLCSYSSLPIYLITY